VGPNPTWGFSRSVRSLTKEQNKEKIETEKPKVAGYDLFNIKSTATLSVKTGKWLKKQIKKSTLQNQRSI
jgi:hypothetical protein